MSDITDLIKDQEALFTDVWSRMDTDRDLVRLAAYSMTDANGKDIKGVTNITRNNPQTLANNILGKLSTSEMQIEVTGKDLKDKDAERVESFATGTIATIDQALVNRDISSLFAFACQQAALRGRISARSTVRTDKAAKGRKGLIDVLPMDTRFVSYITGAYGLESFCYTTTRTKQQIETEWEQVIKTATAVVKDFWIPKQNAVIIDDVEKPQPSPYDYVPAVVVLTNFGLMFADTDNAKYLGESIYMALRDTYVNLNRAATREGTIAEKSVLNATVIKGNSETEDPRLPDHDPTAFGEITGLRKGEELELLKFADINRSSISLDGKLSQDEQKGGSPITAYGDAGGTQSGKQVIALSVAEQRMTGPILMAVSRFYEKLLYLIIRQIVDQKLTVIVGEQGFEEEFRWSELQGKYRIKVAFAPDDPMLDAANLSIAAEAKAIGIFSDDTIRRNFVKVKNPEGEKEKIDNETVEKVDQIILLFRKIHSLIDQGEHDLEAKRLAQKCFQLMGQEAGVPVAIPLPTSKMTSKAFDDLFEKALQMAGPQAAARNALRNVPAIKPARQTTGAGQSLIPQQKGTSGHLGPLLGGGGQQTSQTPEQAGQKQLVAGAMRNA